MIQGRVDADFMDLNPSFKYVVILKQIVCMRQIT